MGKTEFLMLLIAQLRNQDPMNPMDNTEFTAQMAQFSSLEQLFNINETLEMLNTTAAASNSAQAMGLIGKEVTVGGNKVHVKNGIASDISFKLPDSASTVSIQVIDESGAVVRIIEVGSKMAGEHTISWNGNSDLGSPMGDGLYEYNVVAYDSAGAAMEVDTFTTGIVDSVSFENGVAYIHIGDMKFMLGEVRKVSEAGDSSTAEDTSSTDDQTDDQSDDQSEDETA